MFRRNALPLLEITAPDIRPYRKGNTGLEYVTTFDSGKPGPHVILNALTHGNEFCGAHALLWLFAREPVPKRGRLTLCFANWEAYQYFKPSDPYSARFLDEDFNRVWDEKALNGARISRELDRARQLRPLISQADILLDIHSMHQDSPPLMLCGMQDKALALAKQIGVPAFLIRDKGHEAGRRMRDYGAFDLPTSPKVALLVECGQHWLAASVAVAIQTITRLLHVLDLMPRSFFDAAPQSDALPTQRVVTVSTTVTIKSPHFQFQREFRSMEMIPEAGTLIARDGQEEIRTPYPECVLVMPGRQMLPGNSAVRLGRITG